MCEKGAFFVVGVVDSLDDDVGSFPVHCVVNADKVGLLDFGSFPESFAVGGVVGKVVDLTPQSVYDLLDSSRLFEAPLVFFAIVF